MLGGFISRVKETIAYMDGHGTLAAIKDFFLILDGEQCDETLYRVLCLLRDDFNLTPKKNADIILFLNESYNIALASDVSLKKIKKLRRALYNFAIRNNLDLNELINKREDNVITLAIIKANKHKKKYDQLKTAVSKKKDKWLSKIEYELGEPLVPQADDNDGATSSSSRGSSAGSSDNVDFLDPADKPRDDVINDRDAKKDFEAYLIRLQQRVKDKQNALTISQVKHIRHCLRKAYGHYKLTQNLSIINDIIRDKKNNDGLQDKKEKSYNATFDRVYQTLLAIKDNPIKTNLRHQTPSLFFKTPIAWQKNLDYDVYLIIDHLANLQLHKECEGLIEIVEHFKSQRDNNKGLDSREHLQQFLDVLYGIFNGLSTYEDDDSLSSNDEHGKPVKRKTKVSLQDLKKLKKLIHAFAEKNKFDKKLFNLKKLYNQNIADEKVAAKLKRPENAPAFTSNRKYAYIDDLANEVTERKKALRKRKKWLDRLSFAATLMVGIGEGLIAAAFIGWALIPALLLIGIPGFAVNYYLFRKGSYDTLKSFFVDGLYKDKDGNEISAKKKLAIRFTIAFVIGTSLVFAAFTFSSAVAVIGGLLALASIAFPPLVLGLAVVLALAVVIANSGAFYAMMADFIKNDRIFEVGRYLKKTFWDVWKPIFAAKTWREKAICFLKAAGKVVYHGAFLAVMLGICAFITAITLGLGHSYSVNILSQYTKLSADLVNLFSNIAVNYIASPVNNFFYWSGIASVVNTVRKGLAAAVPAFIGFIYKCVTDFKGVIKSIKEGWKEFKANPIRSMNMVFSAIKNGVLLAFAVLNGMGQGAGGYHNAESLSNVESVSHSERSFTKIFAGMIGGVASFCVNVLQIFQSTRLPDPVKIEVEMQDMSASTSSVPAESLKGKEPVNEQTTPPLIPSTKDITEESCEIRLLGEKESNTKMKSPILFFSGLANVKDMPADAKKLATIESLANRKAENGSLRKILSK